MTGRDRVIILDELKDAIEAALSLFSFDWDRQYRTLSFGVAYKKVNKIKYLLITNKKMKISWERLKFEEIDVGLLAARSLDHHILSNAAKEYVLLLHSISFLMLRFFSKIKYYFRSLIVGKMCFAYIFYKNQGFNHQNILSHLRGINFNKPLCIRSLHMNKLIYQYQRICKTNPKLNIQGDYYTPKNNCDPSRLGINPNFWCKICNNKDARRQKSFVVNNNNVKVLESTTKSILDFWSIPKEKPFRTSGGEIQLFNHKDCSRFRLIP